MRCLVHQRDQPGFLLALVVLGHRQMHEGNAAGGRDIVQNRDDWRRSAALPSAARRCARGTAGRPAHGRICDTMIRARVFRRRRRIAPAMANSRAMGAKSFSSQAHADAALRTGNASAEKAADRHGRRTAGCPGCCSCARTESASPPRQCRAGRDTRPSGRHCSAARGCGVAHGDAMPRLRTSSTSCAALARKLESHSAVRRMPPNI